MQAFLLLFLCEILLLRQTSASTMRVQRHNMRVRISAVGDTIVFQFNRPHVDSRLEGYILGYGSSMLSKQLIHLPEDGQPFETEIDAEPKYLIAVQSKKPEEPRKQCTGKVDLEKPLNVVIGSVTQSSVLLSWGTLLTTSIMDSVLEDCIDEGQFTVRYREKEPSNTWNYQTCPSTSTVIDNLKPDALYEFAVRPDTDKNSGAWSPPVIHNTAVSNNITQTRAAPLLKHTCLPKPWKTTVSLIGVENPTTAPDDQPALNEALSSTDTPIFLATPKTTSTVRTQNPTSHPSTTQTDPHTEQHTSLTPHQPTTTQPEPSTTKLQTSTTQPPPTTTKKYTIKTQISVKVQPYTAKQLLNTPQQQFSEKTPSSSTTKPPLHQTQQHTTSTVQEHPYPSKKQDTITQESLHTRKIRPSTKLHRLSTTQRSQGTSKHRTTHTFSKFTSYYQSSTITHSEQPNNKPTTKPNWSTNVHSPTNTALNLPTTLANIQNGLVSRQTTDFIRQPVFSTNPSIPEEYSASHITTTEDLPLKFSTNPSIPEEYSVSQITTTEDLPLKFSTYPSIPEEYSASQITTTEDLPLKFSTNPSIPEEYSVSQITTTEDLPLKFSTNPSIPEEYSASQITTTEDLPLTKNVQELTSHPIYPLTFWHQPQLTTTTQHSTTTKQQASTAKYNPKTYSQVENQPPNPEEQLSGTQKNPLNLTPKTAFIKSDAIQNSPVAEKVTVRMSQPGPPEASSQPKDEQLLSLPTLTNEVANRNDGRGIFHNPSVSRPLARNVTQRLRPHGRVPLIPPTKTFRPPPVYHNSTLNRKRVPYGERHIGLSAAKTQKGPRKQLVKTKLNQVSETKEKEKIIGLKQMDPVPDLKPLAPPTTEKPTNQETSQTTTPQSAFEGSRFHTGDNSSVFSPHPLSEVDATGKKRFVAPHVIYRTDKRPEEPCSLTESLSLFPDEEVVYINVTGPPKTPPSNLTVVTVEGCPSFIILDWDKTDNETTEYDVVSSTKGPHGEEVSIQTTNQTHTAVENLKPESSYEFKVTPKNELGAGPTSDPVSFSTESADPRVSETPTGKNAIWSSFPFRADSYSECNGRQFIKRTWYRKFVGIQLCNSLRYKIYLSDSLKGKFYSIGDQTGYGEDHCQFVDSFLDGRTSGPLPQNQLPPRQGFFRAMRQEPVNFGEIGGNSMINYVAWYECGIPIPGKW
ncbi:target of Nesh-SH3 isoform X2 [Rhinichthys klamathensis goyatoka]|uniref:target of Nesh-SH3 isoform X2 n=1 Tax=Rhinichthys klamathensis goyatoka TaxID=3034132 RepID=UPI0024B5EBE0|nr:target of Nesh-SH3 isoform X2 [Rhinichthys klamathensis goyatoka]